CSLQPSLFPYTTLFRSPSGISQFVEQVFRVVYMLGATYLIMKIQKGSWVDAVTQSTFAAFIGALGAGAVLAWFWMRHRREMNERSEEHTSELQSRFDLV